MRINAGIFNNGFDNVQARMSTINTNLLLKVFRLPTEALQVPLWCQTKLETVQNEAFSTPSFEESQVNTSRVIKC